MPQSLGLSHGCCVAYLIDSIALDNIVAGQPYSARDALDISAG